MKSTIPLNFGGKMQPDFSFTKQKQSGGFVCRVHWHDCFELIYVKKGALNLFLGSKRLALGTGDVAILPPGVLHGTGSDDACELYVYGYTGSLIYSSELSFINVKYLSLFRHPSGEEYRILRSDDNLTASLRDILESAMAAHERDGFTRELSIRSHILQMHAIICEVFLRGQGSEMRNNAYVYGAELYINSHLGEDVSPYDVANALHISYSHLSRVVKGALGCSVGELILKMKLGYAEKLMNADPAAEITDIALRSGFNSASYFTRCFKKVRGITPLRFRELLAAEGDFASDLK